MNPTRLLHLSVLFLFLFAIIGSTRPAIAESGASGGDNDTTIVVRQLTYWQGSFVGYVDATLYEKWPFTLDESHQFVVTAVPATPDLTPLLLLLDANGNEIARGTGTLTTTQPAGSYAIQVQPVNGAGFYVLTLRQLDQATSTPTSTPTATTTPTATATVAPSATPTVTPTATSVPPTVPTTVTPSVITTIAPASLHVGDSATVTVSLANVPVDGYTGAEFTCTYDGTVVEASNIADGGLFGIDAAVALSGPQNGGFIIAIAGSNGRKATAAGSALTFSLKALQVGQTSVECKARVSSGDNTLAQIASSAAALTVLAVASPTPTAIPATPTSTSTTVPTGPSTLNGQVHAGKPVVVSLYKADASLAASVTADSNGSFSLSVSAGSYTAVASASGFLKAQGSVTLLDAQTSTLPTISLLAGDIDGNNVIDQYDAMTIGMNYNGASPAAADLNNDGVINVLDLELLARNYRASGATAWQ